MKYKIATIVLVLLGAAYVTVGHINSNREKQDVLRTRATVSAMSPQKLAAGIADCEPVRSVGETLKSKSTLCTEISRALDERRLQIVEVRPVIMRLPLSLPPLRLRKPSLPVPTLPESPFPLPYFIQQDHANRI